MNDNETGTGDPYQESLLHSREKNYGEGADAPFGGLPPAESFGLYQFLEQRIF